MTLFPIPGHMNPLDWDGTKFGALACKANGEMQSGFNVQLAALANHTQAGIDDDEYFS